MKTKNKSIESTNNLLTQLFYHGTKATMKPGDLIEPGFNSYYGKKKEGFLYLFDRNFECCCLGS
jgi:hypothetical protein